MQFWCNLIVMQMRKKGEEGMRPKPQRAASVAASQQNEFLLQKPVKTLADKRVHDLNVYTYLLLVVMH